MSVSLNGTSVTNWNKICLSDAWKSWFVPLWKVGVFMDQCSRKF